MIEINSVEKAYDDGQLDKNGNKIPNSEKHVGYKINGGKIYLLKTTFDEGTHHLVEAVKAWAAKEENEIGEGR